jgi:hypothetical protein
MNIFKKIGKVFRDGDVWVNEKAGGKEGETISSRLGRYIEDKSKPARGWAARIICRTILLPLGIVDGSKGKHCKESVNEKHK